ncbi:MarR family winged helix-turn-helix transcriptional regulator [Streptomyces corynorhini]|uniref:MarR family transcriptional regulator n=1 Tax=Streptomyces corynorhini TaxID=2282652 RepID=A0A370B5S0_9ACTN|nr:MarR family transcriptional regulator [Streptomyces corynorhini]RDG37150.1 MarR family transcriptional regulator [Streptomyces corynorhini]
MGADISASLRESHEAAQAAREVIELLEVLWERGRDAVSPAPVSTSQLRVLYVLERGDGINLRTLGTALGAAPSSASRLCDRLQALGFIERAPSEVNRRERQLRLTSRGESYLLDLRVRREEALLSAIATLPQATRRALTEGLTGFRGAVDAASPMPGPTRLDDTARPA